LSKLDYLQHWWWAPAIVLWLAGWLVGGAWLLRRSIARQRPDARASWGKCVLAAFAGGLGALVAGGVFFKLFEAIGKAAGGDWTIPALAIAAVSAISAFIVIVYAIFSLSARQTLLSVAPVVGGVVLLTGVIGAAAGVPAWYATQAQRRRDLAERKLVLLWQVLRTEQISALRSGAPREEAVPRSLSEIAGRVGPELLRSPGRPDEEVGVFYLRPTGLLETGSREWIACELGSHDGGRAALRADGYRAWFTQEAFEELMGEPPNARFAEALRAAGGL